MGIMSKEKKDMDNLKLNKSDLRSSHAEPEPEFDYTITFDHNNTSEAFHISEIEMYDSANNKISSDLFTAKGYFYAVDGSEELWPNNGEDGQYSTDGNSNILDGNYTNHNHSFESPPSPNSSRRQRVKVTGTTKEIKTIRIYNRYDSNQDRLIGKSLTVTKGGVSQTINGAETYIFTGDETGFTQSNTPPYMEFSLDDAPEPEFDYTITFDHNNTSEAFHISEIEMYDSANNKISSDLFTAKGYFYAVDGSEELWPNNGED